MLNLVPGQRPLSDAGYLEMMTAVIFMGGLNRQVVMGKWDGFLNAFANFNVDQVALYTPADVERLSQDASIIRNKKRIEATVANAQTMQKMAAEHGSFGVWLRESMDGQGVDATAKAIAKDFKFMSEEGSRRYLFAVGEDVGEVPEKIRQKYVPSS